MARLILIFFFIFVSVAKAEDILSKQDATALFNMNFAEWSANVDRLEQAGLAKSDSLRPLEKTLIVNTPGRQIVTTPSYKNSGETPWKLSLAIIYTGNEAQILKSASLSQHEQMAKAAWAQMQPEFTLVTAVQIHREKVVHDFQIFKKGEFLPMDLAAKKGNGCWQGCVKSFE